MEGPFADWQYFANRRFQHLISGKRRRFPKLKIQSTGIDWFSVQAAWEDETLAMTEADWTRLHQSDDPYVKLSNGTWMEREEAAAMAEAVNALAEIGVQVGAGEQQVGAWQMSGAQQTAWKKLETLVDGESDSVIKQLRQAVSPISRACRRSIGAEGPPSPSCGPTRKPAFIFSPTPRASSSARCWPTTWVSAKRCRRWRGCSICARSRGRSPSLVICPASVVFNWNSAKRRNSRRNRRCCCLTAGEHRHTLRQEIPRTIWSSPTTRCCGAISPRCKSLRFRAIILDEAQNIKNPESMVARAAKALKAEHKLALTGTPLENRLLDLWSIMEFVHPGYLPDRGKFLEQYDRGAIAARARVALQPHAPPSCCAA